MRFSDNFNSFLLFLFPNGRDQFLVIRVDMVLINQRNGRCLMAESRDNVGLTPTTEPVASPM